MIECQLLHSLATPLVIVRWILSPQATIVENSRTTAGHSEAWSVVNGCPGRFNGHDNLGRASGKVTRRIFQLEVDRVNTTITSTYALRPQLDGLAIGCDHDVGRRVAGATGVVGLVTRCLGNIHVVNRERITVVTDARNKVRWRERVIAMVRR